jgi:membrane-associated phospholipid phosphatase
VLHQAGAVDRAVYDTIAGVPTPALDVAMRRLSSSANHSALWLAIAASLGLTGRSGRRAAARGILAIGVTSAIVNLAVKPLATRHRPDRAGAGVPGQRHVSMPSSTSFPSGHSASAFAFATAVSRDNPWIAIVIQFLAGAVAYSRVHTGVHYPGDTIAGALIGAGAGQAVSSVLDRVLDSRPNRRALFREQVVGRRVRVELACRHPLGEFFQPRLTWQPAEPSPDVGHRYRGNFCPRPGDPALLPQP